MDRVEYEAILFLAHSLRLAAKDFAASHDLGAMLAEIEHADALGPIFDPTAHMRQRDKMIEDRDTIIAVQRLAHLSGESQTKGERDA